MKAICYDLFCGLGGWSEGFLAEGYECIGFDIEAHDYGTGGYPGKLILRDIRSIHGSELKDAAVIVASPPCQAYSYRAMPWKRAKALPPPDNTLFNECFRIQREASEADGHHIPLIVENVRGAQKWVGRASWNYGSFYLWGDVPALMPFSKHIKCAVDLNWNREVPDGRKHDGSGWTAKGSLASHNRLVSNQGLKMGWDNSERGKLRRDDSGLKNPNGGSGGWFGSYAEQKERGTISPGRMYGSKYSKRRAASAMIAKIPFPLAQHIARTFKPEMRATA